MFPKPYEEKKEKKNTRQFAGVAFSYEYFIRATYCAVLRSVNRDSVRPLQNVQGTVGITLRKSRLRRVSGISTAIIIIIMYPAVIVVIVFYCACTIILWRSYVCNARKTILLQTLLAADCQKWNGQQQFRSERQHDPRYRIHGTDVVFGPQFLLQSVVRKTQTVPQHQVRTIIPIVC